MSSSPSWATRPVLQRDCFQTANPPTPANKDPEHLHEQWIQNNRFFGGRASYPGLTSQIGKIRLWVSGISSNGIDSASSVNHVDTQHFAPMLPPQISLYSWLIIKKKPKCN